MNKENRSTDQEKASRLEMAHVVRASLQVTGMPVLTSNQCYLLAQELNKNLAPAQQGQGEPVAITDDMHRLMEAYRLGEFTADGGSDTVEALAVAWFDAVADHGHDADSYMAGFCDALYWQVAPFIGLAIKPSTHADPADALNDLEDAKEACAEIERTGTPGEVIRGMNDELVDARAQLETMTADRDAEKSMKATARDQRDRVTAQLAEAQALLARTCKLVDDQEYVDSSAWSDLADEIKSLTVSAEPFDLEQFVMRHMPKIVTADDGRVWAETSRGRYVLAETPSSGDDSGPLISAEPSAPVEPLIPGHRLEAIDELLADADPQSDAVGVPASELRDLVSAVRSFQVRALTDGAPVEIDERAEFEGHLKRKGCEWMTQRMPHEPDIYIHASAQRLWEGWQARAALARKP